MTNDTLRVGTREGQTQVGLYTGSHCGRCGYGMLPKDGVAYDDGCQYVALASCGDVMDGEPLCLRCLADELGDAASARRRK